MSLNQFPRLEIEEETTFEKEINELFELVKNLHLAYKAKEVIYPLREQYRDLMIGGGANHIWFHHNQNGKISQKRVAIIHFDPYYGIIE